MVKTMDSVFFARFVLDLSKQLLELRKTGFNAHQQIVHARLVHPVVHEALHFFGGTGFRFRSLEIEIAFLTPGPVFVATLIIYWTGKHCSTLSKINPKVASLLI
jgi:hypothetical protein